MGSPTDTRASGGADAPTGKQRRPHYAYAIVASCIAITCLPCAIVLSCAGIFFTPVSTFFDVPTVSFTLYFSILNLSMMLTLPVWGRILSGSNIRLALSGAVLLAGLGCAGMGLCREMWHFYICGAVMGAGVSPLIYLAVPQLIGSWFAERVGFFTGLCMAFTGIGGVIFNPVGTALIQSGPEGWRTAYLVFGAVILIGTLPFTALVVRGDPREKGLLALGAKPRSASSGPVVATGVPAARAMRMPAFFALAAFSGLITLNQNIYQFLAGYAQSLGPTMPHVAAASGVVVSAAMAGQAMGKIILGVVNDRSVKLGVGLGIVSGVAGVTLMWLVPGVLPLLICGAWLFGVVYAMTTVQTPLLVRAVFGNADYTNIYSRISMAGSLMGTVSAVLWGIVVDSPGGYPLMFCLGYACMAACLALALFALAKRPKFEAAGSND